MSFLPKSWRVYLLFFLVCHSGFAFCLENTKTPSDLNKSLTINTLDKDGFAPLHRAALKGDLTRAQALIKEGAKVDLFTDISSSHAKYTALHLAAAQGHSNIVKFLLKQGANKTLTSHDGHNAEQLAKSKTIAQMIHNFNSK